MSFNWKALTLYIRERQVVPIIGPELITVVSAGRTTTLERYVAERLTQDLSIDPAALPTQYSLADVSSVFLRQQRGSRRDLYIQVLSILDEQPIQPSPALLQLASIEEFSLFVTTTFDSLLTKALTQARFGGAREPEVCAYSLRSQVPDLDADWVDHRTLLVYHLFGRVSASGDYVISDEDRLEFIHDLQSDSRRPRLLFDQLRDSHLLLIGCSFPDWLTRFFLRALRRERLGIDRDRYEAVADDQTTADRTLLLFLQDCRVQVYPGGTAAFVTELKARMDALRGPAAAASLAPIPVAADAPGAIFLSYASEDRDRVVRIKNTLEAAGIRVWFDQRALEPGEEYKPVIQEAIERCTFFFPCLSANSLTREIRRFFRVEWNRAIQEADYRDAALPFIQPLLLDDTPDDSGRIPPAFRERHMLRCPDGVMPPDFVELTSQRLAVARDVARRR